MITTKDDGTKVVQCGYGTVGTEWYKYGNTIVAKISEIPMASIGATEFDRYNDCEVEISFCNVNSIDTWISLLTKAKAVLQGKTL